ncbi:hypothetical protein TNCV_1376541 [Trichonephila clavipes]|nr:hypothetical protein TNCV_1376541 [Trichonephila clavipes]
MRTTRWIIDNGKFSVVTAALFRSVMTFSQLSGAEVAMAPGGIRKGAVTVLEAKREEFGDDPSIYAKSLWEELETSFETPR